MQLHKVVSETSADLQTINLVYLVNLAHAKHSDRINSLAWLPLHDLQHIHLDSLTQKVLNVDVQVKYTVQADSSMPKVDASSTTKWANDLIIHTDGGSRGNPGPSAAGFVVLNRTGEVLVSGGQYLGITTNNQAEYQAVKLALEKALSMGAKTISFRLDSMLVVNQMIGLYQIKNRDLWPIYTNIKELIGQFDKVTFEHVRREFNSEADALVNKTLDAHQAGAAQHFILY